LNDYNVVAFGLGRWQDEEMKIGTWNLDGRWSVNHQQFLEKGKCDVWLLTEVPNRFALDGGELFRSIPMTPDKSWAGVWSNHNAASSPSPHPAAAMVFRDGVLYCSCVLPWRSARPWWPAEDEGDVSAMTVATLARLRTRLLATSGAVVWGGDWNHALHGREVAGTNHGRVEIEKLRSELQLQVRTERQPHAKPGLLSIDHIAVPAAWRVTKCRRAVAEAGGKRLSDHDAYIVDCVPR
jgi:hypothetical protein